MTEAAAAIDAQLVETVAGPIEFVSQGSGSAVLSLHGTPGGCGQALAAARHFGAAGLRVVAPSRPGYGETPLGAGPGFEQQADLCAALLSELGIDTVAVFAISGGGPTAFQFALRHPQRTSALVLEDVISSRFKTSVKQMIGDQLFFARPVVQMFAKRAEKDPEAAIAQVLSATSTLGKAQVSTIAKAITSRPGGADFIRTFVPNLAAHHHHRGYNNDTRAFADLADLPLEDVSVPALICHGLEDGEVPIEQSRQAASRIPGAELVEVPEAGHILALSERGPDVQLRQVNFVRERAG